MVLPRFSTQAYNYATMGDKFYKMDEESLVTIREELSEDFFALAEEHVKEIRGLVERLDDGRLATQLEFEKYERDRLRQEAKKKTTPITISDEERPTVAEPTNTEQPRQEGPEEELPVQRNQEDQLQPEAGTQEQGNIKAEEEVAPN